MFLFAAEEVPSTELAVEAARIELFASLEGEAGPDQAVALYVEVAASPISIPVPEEPEEMFEVAPRFYTEWLTLPVGELKGRDPDLLDGYRMRYDSETEAEDGFEQFPGAVYHYSHAGFVRASLALDHVSGSTYRIQAEGETEFGWTFRIDTIAELSKVGVRLASPGADEAPAPEAEEWFDRHFNRQAFTADWSRKGSESSGWYVYEAVPNAR